jgi:hypothetical protein
MVIVPRLLLVKPADVKDLDEVIAGEIQKNASSAGGKKNRDAKAIHPRCGAEDEAAAKL